MTTKELLENLEEKRKYIIHFKMLTHYLKSRIQNEEEITKKLSDYVDEITKDTSKIKKFLKT